MDDLLQSDNSNGRPLSLVTSSLSGLPEKARSRSVPDLKRLKAWHLDALRLHMSGLKREEIAEFCNVTPARITQLLADPLAQAFLEKEYAYLQERLKSLQGGAIDVLDSAMKNADQDVAIKAARTVLESQGTFRNGGGGKGNAGAEETVQRILQVVVNNVNVTRGA